MKYKSNTDRLTDVKAAAFNLSLAQVAWVVKDITAAERFFKDTMGIGIGKFETSKAEDYNGTYYGESPDAENLVAHGYSGGAYIELIQPVSGKSIFRDYLDKNPAGGIQHMAYTTSAEELDSVISSFNDKGFPVISSFETSVAKIVFFDTFGEIGVMTEILGLTEEGRRVFKK